MPATLDTISPNVYSTYLVKLNGIQRLDRSGEDCEYCQVEPASPIQVQAYARIMPEHCHEIGELETLVECCVGCLGYALNIAAADTNHPVTIEFETANPVGPPAGTEAGA
jgi:hypothetical protein